MLGTYLNSAMLLAIVVNFGRLMLIVHETDCLLLTSAPFTNN